MNPILSLAISAIQNTGVDSALFLHKFRSSATLQYNNDIGLSNRRTEFMQKYHSIYCAILNRRYHKRYLATLNVKGGHITA